jgi:hypothetical protein
MEHAAQVDVDHRVELLQRHLLQPRVLGDAGVVDQHVDAPKRSFTPPAIWSTRRGR